MKELKLVIEDSGDSSVGIFPQTWVLDCPFLSDEDDDIKILFKEKITDIYSEFAEGRIMSYFEIN